MTAMALTHLFGSRSRDGYATLTFSRGLDRSELDHLATLGFGQTGDQAFRDSLRRIPAGYCRSLPTGRIAVTRCFAGPNDDVGRPTLELRSLIFEPQIYDRLCHDGLDALMANQSLWEDPAFESGETVPLSGGGGAPGRLIGQPELAIFDAWAAVRSKTDSVAVFPDEQRFRDAILRLPQFLSDEDRRHYRWGIRLLGTGPDVQVATLTPNANRSGRRRPIFVEPRRGYISPAVKFLESQREAGRLESLPPVRMLDQPAVESSSVHSSKKPPSVAPRNPFRRPKIIAMAGAGLAALALSMWMTSAMLTSDSQEMDAGSTVASEHRGHIPPAHDRVPPHDAGHGDEDDDESQRDSNEHKGASIDNNEAPVDREQATLQGAEPMEAEEQKWQRFDRDETSVDDESPEQQEDDHGITAALRTLRDGLDIKALHRISVDEYDIYIDESIGPYRTACRTAYEQLGDLSLATHLRSFMAHHFNRMPPRVTISVVDWIIQPPQELMEDFRQVAIHRTFADGCNELYAAGYLIVKDLESHVEDAIEQMPARDGNSRVSRDPMRGVRHIKSILDQIEGLSDQLREYHDSSGSGYWEYNPREISFSHDQYNAPPSVTSISQAIGKISKRIDQWKEMINGGSRQELENGHSHN